VAEQEVQKDSLKKLQGAINRLTTEVGAAKDQADQSKVASAAAQVATDSVAAFRDAAALEAEVLKLNRIVQDMRGVAVKATADDQYRCSKGWELLWDVLRVLVPAALAFGAIWFGSSPLAKVAIGLSIVWIAAILMAAAIRSDQIYALHGGGLGHLLYNLMPSRLFAPLFVAGLFVAIWVGFAALYKDVANMELGAAVRLSFVTLATLNPPDATGALYDLALWQLGAAVLLVICVFSMLINRISEF